MPDTAVFPAGREFSLQLPQIRQIQGTVLVFALSKQKASPFLIHRHDIYLIRLIPPAADFRKMKRQTIFRVLPSKVLTADLLEGIGGITVKLRLHRIAPDPFHVSCFQLGQIRKHKGKPEAEEIVRQTVQASLDVCLLLHATVHRKLPAQNSQFHKIFQVNAQLRLLHLRFLINVVQLCIPQGDGFYNGIVNGSLPKLLPHKELHLAVENAPPCKDVTADIFFQRAFSIKLL